MKTLLQVRISALRIAESCLAWGARVCTTQHLTGLSRRTVTQLADAAFVDIRRGRPVGSEGWYFGADAVGRTEACVLIAQFCRLRSNGFHPVESLLSAYRSVVALSPSQPQLKFDQAFDLAASADGQWTYSRCWLQLSNCSRCECQYISSLRGRSATCPFCVLLDAFRPQDSVLSEHSGGSFAPESLMPSHPVSLPKSR